MKKQPRPFAGSAKRVPMGKPPALPVTNFQPMSRLWFSMTVARSHSPPHAALVAPARSLAAGWPHSGARPRSTSDDQAGGWWKYDGALCLAQRRTVR